MLATKKYSNILILFLGMNCLTGCNSQDQNPERDITVVFCPPCTKKIPKLIRDAKKSIDIAMYDLSSVSVTDELIKAHNKGIKVRIIIERGRHTLWVKARSPVVKLHQRIWQAGIPMKLSKKDHISFHHKNMIIDGKTVYVGSMNFNKGSMVEERFRENYLLITDPITVRQFSDHFESMLRYEPVTDELHKTNNGKGIDVHFSPAKDFAGKIISLVKNAKTHVDMSVNVLTYPPLVDEMIAAHKRGLRVRITLSFYRSWKKYEKQIRTIDRLRKEGVDVRLDPDKKNHNKLIIVDEAIVQTGSPGYDTFPMIRRYETAVVVYSKELAKIYLRSTRPYHERAMKVGMDYDIYSY